MLGSVVLAYNITGDMGWSHRVQLRKGPVYCGSSLQYHWGHGLSSVTVLFRLLATGQ